MNFTGEVAALSSVRRRRSIFRLYDTIGKMYVNNLNINESDDNDDETALPINVTSRVGEENAKVGASTTESSYQDGIADLVEEWEEPELQDDEGTVGQ